MIRRGIMSPRRATVLSWMLIVLTLAGMIIASFSSGLLEYMTVKRFTLDANHFWIGVIVILTTTIIMLQRKVESGHLVHFENFIRKIGWLSVLSSCFFGFSMFLKIPFLEGLTSLAYTGFDISLIIAAFFSNIFLLLMLMKIPKNERIN